jgi:acetoin utilization deacetylase AcuC-like enzyme
MKVFYTDTFSIPLPANHSFPKNKYPLLRKRISEQLDNQAVEMSIPDPATDEEILRAHDLEYFRRFVSGELTDKEIRPAGGAHPGRRLCTTGAGHGRH